MHYSLRLQISVFAGLPEKAKPMDVPQGRTSLYNHQSASITVMSEADRRAADRRAYMVSSSFFSKASEC